MPDSDDVLSKVREAVAAPGSAELPDVYLVLAAIAEELRTANLIASASLAPSHDPIVTTARDEALRRLGYSPPDRGPVDVSDAVS